VAEFRPESRETSISLRPRAPTAGLAGIIAGLSIPAARHGAAISATVRRRMRASPGQVAFSTTTAGPESNQLARRRAAMIASMWAIERKIQSERR
jgi:hypothetical protein